jgi:hypothetical protein
MGMDNCCDCGATASCAQMTVTVRNEWHGVPRFSPWVQGSWSYADGGDPDELARMAPFFSAWSNPDPTYGGFTNGTPGSVYDHQRYLQQEWFVSGQRVTGDGLGDYWLETVSLRHTRLVDAHVGAVVTVAKRWTIDGVLKSYDYAWNPTTGAVSESGTDEPPEGWHIDIPAPDTGWDVEITGTITATSAHFLHTGTVDFGFAIFELSCTREYDLSVGYSLSDAATDALAPLAVSPTVRGEVFVSTLDGLIYTLGWSTSIEKGWELWTDPNDGLEKKRMRKEPVGPTGGVQLFVDRWEAVAGKTTFKGCGNVFSGHPYELMEVTDTETGAGVDTYLDVGTSYCDDGTWTGGGEFTIEPADMPVTYGGFQLSASSGTCP